MSFLSKNASSAMAFRDIFRKKAWVTTMSGLVCLSAFIAGPGSAAEGRAAMLEYWGNVEDILAQAVGDAQSAYDDGDDRSMAANYLSNCDTNIFSASFAAADSDKVPRGWDDVRDALKTGLRDYGSICREQRTKLYSGGSAGKGRAIVSKMPASLVKALHLARLHLTAAGADPRAIRLP